MITLLCPVCRAALQNENTCLRCENGHSFDVARQGYVNLLPVEQKHSLHPGDTREMVAARRRFLSAGYYAPIAEAVCGLIKAYAPEATALLDVGCGEGYYTRAIADSLPDPERWGMDISKDAVRYCAGQDKQGHFFVGTASHLPFEDGSFSVLLSMFALTLPEEFARVLEPNGIFIQVLAGEDHLPALKSIIYPRLHYKEKVSHPELPGFRRIAEKTLEFSFELTNPEHVQDLLSMTPHVWRISKEGAEQLKRTQTLRDRAQVILNVFCKE
ncbi:MAG: methyltransferase domain-containing protein [Clostridia bacterium]|nr:methyltransferase domain-containing protein [Clostridia bacterium]